MWCDSCWQPTAGRVRDHGGTSHTQTNQEYFSNPWNTTICCSFDTLYHFLVLKAFFLRNFSPLMCNFRFQPGTTLQVCVTGAAFMIFLVPFSRQKLHDAFYSGHVSGNILDRRAAAGNCCRGGLTWITEIGNRPRETEAPSYVFLITHEWRNTSLLSRGKCGRVPLWGRRGRLKGLKRRLKW